ncbi:MAG: ATP-binding cassette domain-containing protein [Lachnospiraceae bacterium]|nr:ATP-binding cassette domain-containing protein [Lachnospiraceae bacterium]
MSLIEFDNVSREFKIANIEKGAAGTIKSLFHREYIIKKAVDDISFHIESGEVVGYIGANGAGKSTTIKLLSGILYPTKGQVRVDGISPYKKRKQNASQIGVVFGQRSQLFWDLPFGDTLNLYKKMYNIPDDIYNKNYRYFVELLDMQEFINQPARQLSLGQKMKANIMVSMLHDPKILYLDEPTIGLDVVTKRKLRECIKEINQDKKTTIILTTHDMNDIEAVCSRLILIDKGKKLFDGSMDMFRETYAAGLEFVLEFSDICPAWTDMEGFRLAGVEELKWKIVYKGDVKESSVLCTRLIEKYHPVNIWVGVPSIENIVADYYSKPSIV